MTLFVSSGLQRPLWGKWSVQGRRTGLPAPAARLALSPSPRCRSGCGRVSSARAVLGALTGPWAAALVATWSAGPSLSPWVAHWPLGRWVDCAFPLSWSPGGLPPTEATRGWPQTPRADLPLPVGLLLMLPWQEGRGGVLPRWSLLSTLLGPSLWPKDGRQCFRAPSWRCKVPCQPFLPRQEAWFAKPSKSIT